MRRRRKRKPWRFKRPIYVNQTGSGAQDEEDEREAEKEAKQRALEDAHEEAELYLNKLTRGPEQ